MGSYNELVERNGEFAAFINQFAYISNMDNEENRYDSESDVIPTDVTLSSPDVHTFNDNIRRRQISKESYIKEKTEQEGKQEDVLISEEAVEEGSITFSIISTYIKAASLSWLFICVFGLLVNIGGMVGNNVWLSFWSNDAVLLVNGSALNNLNERLVVYAVLGVTQAFGVFILSGAVAFGSLHAAKSLHGHLLKNTFRSPISFFDTTPVGRILNRFSKDVDTCDTDLRNYIQNWLSIMAKVIATIVMITYSTPIFVVVIIPLAIIFAILQRVYIKTAQQVKRIDSIKRSPVYSFFSETLNGVSSIRAYKQQDRFNTYSDQLLDNSQKVWFCVFTLNRWITLWSEVSASMFVLFAAVFAILQRDTLDAGTIGLSVSYALQITFQIIGVVRFSCEIETNIVAVERIKEYTEIPSEAPFKEEYRPSQNWPQEGNVKFENYQTRYRPSLDIVLKDITFHINAGDMVGIVGRTGAGKSSLTLALFRIIESAGGTIYIDGENIADMGLHDLRSRITIIPQDPVLFSGSLRFNIDPSEKYSDGEIWTALEQAHLKEFVASLPDGFDFESGENGENLSVGQRQLICLSRALLKKTKILVMDEATSAVDLETDELIQSTIRREFKDCTIITIAHRLNTILDYDRVLVMDGGMVKEYDTPRNLLEDSSSIFFSMAFNAGIISSQT